MLIKGAGLPLLPIFLRDLLSLRHKSLAPVTCQCQLPCTSLLFPKILGNCSPFEGLSECSSPQRRWCSATHPLPAITGLQRECNEYPQTYFLSHHLTAFSLSALLVAGWERDRSTSWFPPSQTSFFPGLLPFHTHLASCGYRDDAEMLTPAPNSSMVETAAGSKALELAEDCRDQGSFPKIPQNQPTTGAFTSPISWWRSKSPQLHWDWGFASDPYGNGAPWWLFSCLETPLRQSESEVVMKISFWIRCFLGCWGCAAPSCIQASVWKSALVPRLILITVNFAPSLFHPQEAKSLGSKGLPVLRRGSLLAA